MGKSVSYGHLVISIKVNVYQRNFDGSQVFALIGITIPVVLLTVSPYLPSEHVIISAFPQQQWLQECASLLRHVYVAFLI